MQMIPIGRSILAWMLLCAVALVPALAGAQAYPSKPVKLIVPFGAGGNSDSVTRVIADWLSRALNGQFVVENKAGAGGAIAAETVARASPDGYTLFMTTLPQLAILPHIQKVTYDPLKDFSPISIVGTNPFVLGVHQSTGAKTLKELIELARSQPGRLSYAGANGSIASEFVARAAPDGHTLMLGYIATHAMNPALQKLRYDPVTDFEPVGLVGYSATLMVANANTPVKDVKDLVAQLKAKPDKYTYATAGNGTAPHFAGELFKLNAGVVMLGVPYKGAAPAVNDTIGGQTQFMFPSLFTALPHVKGGKLKALAVAGPKRSALLPDVPTLKEAGVEGVEVQQWYALFAPGKTPKAVVDRLNKALNEVLSDKDVIQRMENHGADVETSTPEQLGAMVKTELVKWKEVVTKAKLTAN